MNKDEKEANWQPVPIDEEAAKGVGLTADVFIGTEKDTPEDAISIKRSVTVKRNALKKQLPDAKVLWPDVYKQEHAAYALLGPAGLIISRWQEGKVICFFLTDPKTDKIVIEQRTSKNMTVDLPDAILDALESK